MAGLVDHKPGPKSRGKCVFHHGRGLSSAKTPSGRGRVPHLESPGPARSLGPHDRPDYGLNRRVYDDIPHAENTPKQEPQPHPFKRNARTSIGLLTDVSWILPSTASSGGASLSSTATHVPCWRALWPYRGELGRADGPV